MAATESLPLLPVRLIAAVADEPSYLLLRDEQGRTLPILVGASEAGCAATRLEGKEPARPMPYDLLHTLLEHWGVRLIEVRVERLADTVFIATLVLDGEPGTLDCRPSDAINLALLTNAPILVAEAVMAEASFGASADVPEPPEIVDARLAQELERKALEGRMPTWTSAIVEVREEGMLIAYGCPGELRLPDTLPRATRPPGWLLLLTPRDEGEADATRMRIAYVSVEGQVSLGAPQAQLLIEGDPGGVTIGADVVAAWDLVDGETVIALARPAAGRWLLAPAAPWTNMGGRYTAMQHVQALLDRAVRSDGLTELTLRPRGTCVAVDFREQGRRTIGTLPATLERDLLAAFCLRAGLPPLPTESDTGAVELPGPEGATARLQVNVEVDEGDWSVVVRPA